jgi:hypothetical protein
MLHHGDASLVLDAFGLDAFYEKQSWPKVPPTTGNRIEGNKIREFQQIYSANFFVACVVTTRIFAL